jgi:hypothetical protein
MQVQTSMLHGLFQERDAPKSRQKSADYAQNNRSGAHSFLMEIRKRERK